MVGVAYSVGFLITSIPILQLAHVTQYLVDYHALQHPSLQFGDQANPYYPSEQEPIVVKGLQVFTHSNASSSMATIFDGGGQAMILAYGTCPGLEGLPRLLRQFLKQGPRYLTPLAGDQGWGTVVMDFATKKVMIATDAFGTKPIHVASSSDGFAISSHPSALLRLGFTPGSLREINQGTITVMDMATLSERYSLDLEGLVPLRPPPPSSRPQGAAGADEIRALPTSHPSAALDVDFEMAVKRSLGMIFRRPMKKKASKAHAPRFFLVMQDRSGCQLGANLLVAALSQLPMDFVVYRLGPMADIIYKFNYQGTQQGRKAPAYERLGMATDDILQYVEP